MKQEQDKSAKKRDRRLLGLAGGIFVLAACVFGGLYSQRNAAQGESVAPTKRKGYAVPDISPEKKAEFVERAKFLRAKMEPWARKHQAELKRMIAGGADSSAAGNVIWKVATVDPASVGIGLEELMPSGNPTVGIGFGWYPLSGRRELSTDPKMREMAQGMVAMGQAQFRNDLKKYHDIKFMGASSGLTRTYIWASGRVTQVTELDAEEYMRTNERFVAEGRRFTAADMYEPPQEMVSPFDFLTSTTS